MPTPDADAVRPSICRWAHRLVRSPAPRPVFPAARLRGPRVGCTRPAESVLKPPGYARGGFALLSSRMLTWSRSEQILRVVCWIKLIQTSPAEVKLREQVRKAVSAKF